MGVMTVHEQSIVEGAEVVTVDAFANGFAAEKPGDPWFYVSMDTYVTADGRAATLPGGGLR
jgi:hypothetical protein